MCLKLTKHVRKVHNKLRDEYRSLAQNTMKLLMALFAFLSYASEIRPFVISSLGIYFGGFLDCTVIALLLLATVFYVRSKWRWKDKNQIKFGSRFEWGWTPSSNFFPQVRNFWKPQLFVVYRIYFFAKSSIVFKSWNKWSPHHQNYVFWT